MIHAFWTELRRSPLRRALPALIAVDLAAVFGRDALWFGSGWFGSGWFESWPQASAAAQLPAPFFAPIVAAAAAFAAGRARRGGFEERLRTAALPAWRPELAQLAATVALGLAAYGTGAVAAAAASLPDAGPGFLWPGYVLLGAATVVGCAGIGHAVGRRSRSALLAPVCCAVGLFVVLGVLGPPLELFVLSGDARFRVSGTALATRLALGAALVGPALAAPRRGFPGSRVGAAGFAAVLAGAVAAVAAGGPLRTARAVPARPACSAGGPQVCVWPEDRAYLPEISAMARRLAALPPDVVRVPPVFLEDGLRDAPGGAFGDFRIAGGGARSASPGLARAVVRNTLAGYCPAADRAAGDRRAAATFELETWLRARADAARLPDVRGGPPGADLARVARVLRGPEDAQSRWAGERMTAINETPCA
ncbi:hypothetical protein [Actinomadura atramentaria]|uniref:hypothetical protein n=1 Tax=Actinomadura atramentaria TaxID=1990 RepID=UPI00036AC6D4|nr:hypothetical protein [Actinomadura atramentaria]